MAINQVVLHYAQGNLPFGGVNNSGIGNAHGEFGFKTFSHERGVLKGGLDQRRQDAVLPTLHGPQVPPGFAVPGDAEVPPAPVKSSWTRAIPSGGRPANGRYPDRLI